ncbi:Neurochondrin-domain-containing protein [Lasiosphaeris hirsuta]|uniref:Neurochondrin-domain-containing protein n=1 Tax=Lasiosphaeris hirsuta TaxID=260670 RepID=A0AA40A900_9PEZI|nr:Neurochondrin-domain-containing protein [Lasiosphaeris hirsuta]
METPSVCVDEQKGSIQKIQTLLAAKDDTSRFVGLALLKSVLDNDEDLRGNEEIVVTLWKSIPPKFVDRLIQTGARQKASRKDASDMLDLAVSVLHTFAVLLPEVAKANSRILDRIPQLVAGLLHCSNETAHLALETLVSLVSQPAGALVFIAVEDLSPLTEIAPSQPLVLDTLSHAWLNSMTDVTDKAKLRTTIDKIVGSLVSFFKGTDAVTLLDFLANLLPRLDPEILPPNPSWLSPLGKFIRTLATSRPTAASRAASTNLAAALLEAYPIQAPTLLFSDGDAIITNPDDKPFSYLFIHLLLIDLRASLPLLLEQLNSPAYPAISLRLTSAFNVVSHYTGYLLRSLDAPTSTPWILTSPDLLLKLRVSLSETMSLAIEFLRDRWDASVAGALGLHPSARDAEVTTFTAAPPRRPLTWESKEAQGGVVPEDPLVLAGVRALAVWLREDDNEMLRKEAAGLADMFVELFRGSGEPGRLDFRRAVLVALEGITVEWKGVEAFLKHGGWSVLADDLLAILQAQTKADTDDAEAARGVEVVRVLLPIVEAEDPGVREEWMDLVTRVAAWDVPAPEDRPVGVVEEFQVAVLQLVTALLVNTHAGMQKRSVHSTSAVLGIAGQLKKRIRDGGGDPGLKESLEDVLTTLGRLR